MSNNKNNFETEERKNKYKLEDINKQINDIETTVEDNYNELKNKNLQNSNNIENNTKSISQFEEHVQTIEQKNNQIENSLNNIQTQIETFDDRLSSLDVNLEGLNSKANKNAQNLEAIDIANWRAKLKVEEDKEAFNNNLSEKADRNSFNLTNAEIGYWQATLEVPSKTQVETNTTSISSLNDKIVNSNIYYDKEIEIIKNNVSNNSTGIADALEGLADTYSKSEVDSKNTLTLENSKSYIDTKVADLVNSAPETLNTLGELASALQENQDIVSTLNNAVANKVDKTITVNGKPLSSSINITKTDVGLGYVNNTSDIDKPISTATQNALNLKANESDLNTTNGELNKTQTRLQQVITAHDNLVDKVENKVNKLANEFEGFSAVYSVNTDQEHLLQKVSINSDQYSLAVRDANGNTSFATPTQNSHAATKKYVDDILNTKVDKSTKINGKELSENINITASELNTYTKDETNNLLDKKSNSSELDTLSNQVSNINNQVETNKEDITNLKTNINSNLSSLTSLQNAIKQKVDKSTTINNKALTSNIELSANDVGAISNSMTFLSSISRVNDDLRFYKSNNTNNATLYETISPASSSLSGLMSKTDKSKLDGIETGAEKNIQTDWNETDTTSPAYLKNKPEIPKGSVLYDCLGQNTDGSVNQKVITDSLNSYKDYLAISNTGSTSVNLTATLQGIYNFTLKNGLEVYVKFTNGINFSDGQARTLNINSTGAKNVNVIAPQNWTYKFKQNVDANDIVKFVYNEPSNIWMIKEIVTKGINTNASFKWLNAIKLAQSNGTDRSFYGEEDISLSNSYVDKFASQDIAGTKNFTTTPTINGVNIANTNDIPSKTSQLTNDSGFTTFSGNYNDLVNKPTIPNAISVDSALSTTSTNPVQNKVINSALSNKVDKVSGMGLSTNDYTTAEKTKLSGIETGAQVNVKSDWLIEDYSSPAFIVNKPTVAKVTLEGDSSNTAKTKLVLYQSSGQNTDGAMTQKVATNLLSTKASYDLSNVTYPANTAGSTTVGSGDRVIETYISSDKKTWYRKWASGWKECGIYASLSSWSEGNVTLPITFSSNLYTCVATSMSSSTSTGLSSNQLGIVSKTTNTVRLWCSTSSPKMLYCCGY